MAYKKIGSKYSKDFTAELNGKTAVILAEAKEALTIDQIKLFDMSLTNVSSQKIARSLNHLIDMGFAVKSKNKAGRMVYKSIGVMEEQGYNTRNIVGAIE